MDKETWAVAHKVTQRSAALLIPQCVCMYSCTLYSFSISLIRRDTGRKGDNSSDSP